MASRRIAVFLGLIVVVVGAIGAMGTVGGTTTAGMETAPGSSVAVDLSDPEKLEAADGENVSSPITSDNPNLELEFEGGYAERFIVEGYRDGRLGPFPDVRVDETLRIPIRVINTGDTAETYSFTLRENGAAVEEKSGDLGPSEETVLEFTIDYDDHDGNISELEIADWSTIVTVYDRDAMVLTDLSVSKITASVGDEIKVTATVENGDGASSATVDIMNYNETIHSETVSLDAGESTTVETTYTMEEDVGPSFSVEGEFVTGSVARVTTEWDFDEATNGTEREDKGAINYSDLNESAWDVNISGFNDSDVEFNNSDFNFSEINDSDFEFNESKQNLSNINESRMENLTDVEVNESNITTNATDWENESWENQSNVGYNNTVGNESDPYSDESGGETPGFGIGAMMVAGVTLTVLLRRRS